MLILAPKLSEDTPSETPRSSISEPVTTSSPHLSDNHSPPPQVLSIDRPKSACDDQLKEHHDAWYPRRLSFSIAQDAIETWYGNSRSQLI
jgi:hypothetical protein